MAEIIDLLAELGARLRLDDNALLQESFALAKKRRLAPDDRLADRDKGTDGIEVAGEK